MNVGEETVLYGQLHKCHAFCIVSAVCGGISESFTILFYLSFEVDESVKHLHSLSSVQGSSLLREVEMLPLIVLMVLINGVVLE